MVLEGRARAGFHTGGRCYGYTTIPEPDPADAEHPRAVVRIHPNEAARVRAIFEAYAAGESAHAIAARLNEEHVPAPYDPLGYEKRAGRGWATNQIQSLLRNERYIGRVVWNRREFYRDPKTKKRHARLRPENEWITIDAPDLAIVPRDLWDAAQERHRAERRRVNGKKKVRLLSGFLRWSSRSGRVRTVRLHGSLREGRPDSCMRRHACAIYGSASRRCAGRRSSRWPSTSPRQPRPSGQSSGSQTLAWPPPAPASRRISTPSI